MKFPNLILGSVLLICPLVHAGDFEIIDGNAAVSGKPNAMGSQARENWTAACEQWKSETKQLNSKDDLMMISCGTPSCDATDGIFTCSSNATFKVKVAGTRVGQPAPVVTASETIVETAPPPVIIETPAPRPGFIWIGGFWGWRDHRHFWSPGHYEPHRSGYAYISPRWVASGRGYRLEHGYWRH